MARGRKPSERPPPPRPEGDYSQYRVRQYHLCGHEIFAQAFPRRDFGGTYYFHWFATDDPNDQTPLQVCPDCRGRVAHTSVRLPLEQYQYELAQESLALQLAHDREVIDAQEDTPP